MKLTLMIWSPREYKAEFVVFFFEGIYFCTLRPIFSSLRWRAEIQFFIHQALDHKGSRKNTNLSAL
jgi:hypothetical protein